MNQMVIQVEILVDEELDKSQQHAVLHQKRGGQ